MKKYGNKLTRNTLLYLLIIIMLCGCSQQTVTENIIHPISEHDELLVSLLGKPKTDVLTQLHTNNIALASEDGNLYYFKQPVQGGTTHVTVELMFYNELLKGYRYLFEDVKVAYDSAKDYRQFMEQIFGAPTTKSDEWDRLDNTKSFEDFMRMKQFMRFEEWEVDSSKEFALQLYGPAMAENWGYRVWVRLGIEYQENQNGNANGIVSIKYDLPRKYE